MQKLTIPASVAKRKQACKSCRQRKKQCSVCRRCIQCSYIADHLTPGRTSDLLFVLEMGPQVRIHNTGFQQESKYIYRTFDNQRFCNYTSSTAIGFRHLATWCSRFHAVSGHELQPGQLWPIGIRRTCCRISYA
jgi:hypothetical protein